VKGLSVGCVGWGGGGDYVLGLVFIVDVEEGCFLLPFLVGYKTTDITRVPLAYKWS
jgi:hypothetical protein